MQEECQGDDHDEAIEEEENQEESEEKPDEETEGRSFIYYAFQKLVKQYSNGNSSS